MCRGFRRGMPHPSTSKIHPRSPGHLRGDTPDGLLSPHDLQNRDDTYFLCSVELVSRLENYKSGAVRTKAALEELLKEQSENEAARDVLQEVSEELAKTQYENENLKSVCVFLFESDDAGFDSDPIDRTFITADTEWKCKVRRKRLARRVQVGCSQKCIHGWGSLQPW